MKLNAPKKITWWISLVLAIIAIIVYFTKFLGSLEPHVFIILLVAFILLWLGTFVKGL